MDRGHDGIDAPVDYMARTRQTYQALGYEPYRWVHNDDPPPWKPLEKPLSECRVALIGSGGIYLKGQIAFHYRDDTTIREIDSNCSLSDLRVTHFAYDTTDARKDINVVFPLGTLRDLAGEGMIREVAPFSYGFLGGIYSARRVREELIPSLVPRLVDQEVDAALLVPV